MNIFVKNLSSNVGDEALRELFEQYGRVQRAMVKIDRNTGISSNYGFVIMDDDEASKAIEALNQTEFEGKVISVQEGRERHTRY